MAICIAVVEEVKGGKRTALPMRRLSAAPVAVDGAIDVFVVKAVAVISDDEASRGMTRVDRMVWYYLLLVDNRFGNERQLKDIMIDTVGKIDLDRIECRQRYR